MKRLKRLSIAALALVGAVLSGCSSDDALAPVETAKGKAVTLTTTVSLGDGGSGMRALTSAGVKTFAAGDKIAVVYKNTSDQTVKVESEALTDADITSGTSATFTVTLTDPKASAAVRYIYPAVMAATNSDNTIAVNADATINYEALATQDGTLATLASSLDLAVYDGTLTSAAALPTSGTLANKLAILACTVKNSDASTDLTGTITGLSVSDGTNSYAVSRTAAAGPIYVAIQPADSKDITIKATAGSTIYSKILSSKTYAANNGYNVSWKMTEGDLTAPLTFEAKEACTITLLKDDSAPSNVQISTDGGVNWEALTAAGVTLAAGDKAMFRGDNSAYGSNISANCYKFSLSGQCYAYGNIMSLISSTAYATTATLTGSYAFTYLFLNQSNLLSKDGSPLLLPATTLAQNCYTSMFQFCEALTSAPALPAETLAEGCYSSMFYGCTGLTSAPALPATTLANYCYFSMFNGCSKLASVKCYATNISASGCLSDWLDGAGTDATSPTLYVPTSMTEAFESYKHNFTIEGF